jgi:RecA/RadA recombinase
LSQHRLPTGVVGLDKLLRGGILGGEITLIYGEAGTGKTILAFHLSIQCARTGFNVIYVDSDLSFPAERLRRLGVEAEKLKDLIGIFTPRNFYEQSILVENLDRYYHPELGLVVFDTVNSLYRFSASNPEYLTQSNKELNRQLAHLARFTKKTQCPIVLTSQVRGVIKDSLEAEKVEPVAARILNFWSQTQIQLKSTPRPNVKMAFLKKFNGRIKENIFCHFKITDWNVE